MARVPTLRQFLVGGLWCICLLVVWAVYPHQTYNGYAQLEPNASDPVTLQRISRKLEFVNGKLTEKNSEISILRSKVQQISATLVQDLETHHHEDTPSAETRSHNLTEAPLNVPNLFQLMPHLNNDIRTLYPHRSIGHAKHNVEMVLAVPHVHRPREDYLLKTLHSLFTQMSSEQMQSSVIVVMVAEPFNETEFDIVVKEVASEFAAEIDQGHLEVILPPAKWYPDLDNLPQKWGDTAERAKWRTKQNLDYAFMMLYCSHIGTLYVQLEDDITAKPHYISSMKHYAATLDRWELLEFSQLGFIGKMFKSAMLPKFVSFILMFYQHKPVDWLLDNYFWVQECQGKNCADLAKVRKRFRPSLFQHEGYHSSLPGKVQKLKDKDFNKKSGGGDVSDPVITAHSNPSAELYTSLKIYKDFTLAKLWTGKSVFWALNPQPDDHITIKFQEPQTIKKYRVVSGDRQHKDDRLANATLEFLPVNKEAPLPADTFRLDDSGYVGFKFFNTSGLRENDDETRYTIAEGSVPPSFGLIRSVRILSHVESQNWVIISEIWFET